LPCTGRSNHRRLKLCRAFCWVRPHRSLPSLWRVGRPLRRVGRRAHPHLRAAPRHRHRQSHQRSDVTASPKGRQQHTHVVPPTFSSVLGPADDSAPRPGSCGKPPSPLYVKSGKECDLLALLFARRCGLTLFSEAAVRRGRRYASLARADVPSAYGYSRGTRSSSLRRQGTERRRARRRSPGRRRATRALGEARQRTPAELDLRPSQHRRPATPQEGHDTKVHRVSCPGRCLALLSHTAL